MAEVRISHEKVVISRSCTWWNLSVLAELDIDDREICPVCKSPLFEAGNLFEWFKEVEAYAEQTNDIRFPDYIEWVQGKCYLDAQEARLIWEGMRLS